MMTTAGRICLMLARLTLAVWVGAATLFVVNGVLLATSGAFESVHRDHIALIRFPPYYVFGFVSVGLALVCLALARGYPRKLAMGLVVTALVLMLVDYFGVYRPLESMISPPGQPRSSEFGWYHRASMMVNTIHVGLCLIAAGVLSYPRKEISTVGRVSESPAQ